MERMAPPLLTGLGEARPGLYNNNITNNTPNINNNRPTATSTVSPLLPTPTELINNRAKSEVALLWITTPSRQPTIIISSSSNNSMFSSCPLERRLATSSLNSKIIIPPSRTLSLPIMSIGNVILSSLRRSTLVWLNFSLRSLRAHLRHLISFIHSIHSYIHVFIHSIHSFYSFIR